MRINIVTHFAGRNVIFKFLASTALGLIVLILMLVVLNRYAQIKYVEESRSISTGMSEAMEIHQLLVDYRRGSACPPLLIKRIDDIEGKGRVIADGKIIVSDNTDEVAVILKRAEIVILYFGGNGEGSKAWQVWPAFYEEKSDGFSLK